jgi:hypothetical protein
MWQKLSLIVIALIFIGLVAHRVWHSADVTAKRHEHMPGSHEGVVVSLGGDRYHVEAVFTTGGLLKLYTLDRDGSRVLEVEAQTLTAHLTPEGDLEAHWVELHPEPQSGDAPGRASCFCGRLPQALPSRSLRVSVPNFRINGERFHLTFARHAARHMPVMPAQVGEGEERALHLVAGGRYTTADIEANGRTVPSLKYRGFQARHDIAPQPGDRLCPVTHTKANPACTWTVGGRVYQFCCPPCIDEFVRQAKEQPDRLVPPEAYVK